MPSAKFSLETGGPKRIEITWRMGWKDIVVQFDGEEVGRIPSRTELKQGRSFTLPDGSELHVRLKESFGNVELQVSRDGRPLPGSASDPAQRLKAAGYIIYFIAALSGVVGAVAMIFQVEFLEAAGIGWTSLVGAAVYGLLGFFTLRKSKPALMLAIAIFILDGLAGLVMGISAKGSPPIGMIFVRVFLVMAMIRGVPAIDELKRGNDEDVKKVFD